MSISVRSPNLAFLTQDAPGATVAYLNLQFMEIGITRGQGPLERVVLSNEQMTRLNADFAAHLAGRAVP